MSTQIRHRAFATVTGHTATYTSLHGTTEQVTTAREEDIRQAIIRRATDDARTLDAPIELVTAGDRGAHRLLITPTGTPQRLPPGPVPPGPAVATNGHPAGGTREFDSLREEVRETVPRPVPERAPGAPAAEPPARPSFLTDPTPTTSAYTAGWRGFLVRGLSGKRWIWDWPDRKEGQ